MSKPTGTKYALFPNFWEFLNLIASVLGLGTKATVWGNNKTFYEIGYLPVANENGGVNAIDTLKHIVEEAQRKQKLSIFPKSPWKSSLTLKPLNNDKTYIELAPLCIKDYFLQIRNYSPRSFRMREFWQFLTQSYPDQSKLSKIFSDPQEWNKSFFDFISYREEQRVKDICIAIVCNYLGNEYQEECQKKYDELFHQTLFNPNDYQELLTKDLENWTQQEKTLAFSIPFGLFSYNQKNHLYSKVIERVLNNPDQLANKGSTHPNKWIDQYTQLGFSFEWMPDEKIDDLSKLVLRKEENKKGFNLEKFKHLLPIFDNPEIKEPIEEFLAGKLDPYKDSLRKEFNIKGADVQLKRALNMISNHIPQNAQKQLEDPDFSSKLICELDKIESSAPTNKNDWMMVSKLFPFFGATGDLCKEKLQPHLPLLKGLLQNHPEAVKKLTSKAVTALKENKIPLKSKQKKSST